MGTQTKNYYLLRGQQQPASCIIAVGGGKGGVGKSFISSSIAIFLAKMGYKTYAIDLDLGGSNLHTSLGEPPASVGINEFIQNSELNLMDVSHTSKNFSNLKLVSGASEALDIANIKTGDASRIMSAIHKLPADYVILDLSAGTHSSTIDFFLMASHRLIVMTPEPNSIENAYRFMKSSFHRQLQRMGYAYKVSNVIEELMSQRAHYNIRMPSDLIRQLTQLYPEKTTQLHQILQNFCFELVVNQAYTLQDLELAASIQTVCEKYFGISTQALATIEHDNAVWQSLRLRRHLLLEYPHSRLYNQLMGLTRKLIQGEKTRAAA